MSARGASRLVALGLVAVVCALYANSIAGDFVYDDARQIVPNHLIRSNDQIARALTSDVWAFKGEKGAAWSNYWRPLFTLLLIVNHRLFGLENTAGWHAANIALHAAVCVLALGVLRRLAVPLSVAAAALLLFAVHPVHVESVAWISGSPNMLCAAPLLASLWIFLGLLERPSALGWAAALALYALSLLAKETALVFPALAFLAAFTSPAAQSAPALSRSARARRAALAALPFAAVAAAYFAARLAILGRVEMENPWSWGPGTILATAPSLLAFYALQTIFPLRVGPSYPLRPIPFGEIGLANFVLPLAILLVAGWVAVRAARASRAGPLALGFFVLPLLPALNLNAFIPEHIAHDRYLYLPVLGAAILAVTGARGALARRLPGGDLASGRACLAGAAILAIPLMVQTRAYNAAYRDELSLWTWAARVDPGSSFNHTELARALRRAGRTEEAKRELARAIAIYPNQYAMTERAIIALAERRAADAEKDLRWVIENTPAELAAYEQLVSCLEAQGRAGEGVAILRTARERLPHYTGRITSNLAVVLYWVGRKEEARAELEGARASLAREPDGAARRGLYLLGSLYAESGLAAPARAAYEEFLATTAGATDDETRAMREEARGEIAKLGG